MVLLEGLILNGDGSLLQGLRDLGQLHQFPVFAAVEGEMLHILSRGRVLIIDGAGLVHDKVGLQMGLGDNDRTDIIGRKTAQNHRGDDSDKQERTKNLSYGRKYRYRRGTAFPPPLRTWVLIVG